MDGSRHGRTGRKDGFHAHRADQGGGQPLCGHRHRDQQHRHLRHAQSGGRRGATGENPAIVACRTADVIIGPIGILAADSLMGEVTPSMAVAVGQSGAKKLLLPVNLCNNIVVGDPVPPHGQADWGSGGTVAHPPADTNPAQEGPAGPTMGLVFAKGFVFTNRYGLPDSRNLKERKNKTMKGLFSQEGSLCGIFYWNGALPRPAMASIERKEQHD